MQGGIAFIVLSALLILYSIKCLVNLGHPTAVVFDEVHYGSICELYRSGKFFIDSQPPLARIIICLNTNKLDGIHAANWSKIGNDLPSYSFAFGARLPNAMFSIACLVSALYLIRTMNYSFIAMSILSFLWMNDPALIVQGRYMFPDSMALSFQLLALCFCKRSQWMMSSLFIGFSMSSHTSSSVTWLLVCGIAFNHIWSNVIDPTKLLVKSLFKMFFAFVKLIFIPLGIYVMVFYANFKLLPNSGPHDHMVSSNFQSTLNGGLSGKIYPIKSFSYITLKSKSRNCFLSSGKALYPEVYKKRLENGEEAGSSHEQMVSCTETRGQDNWWLISVLTDEHHNVSNGSVITLFHIQTSRDLKSHSVAAPFSKHKCEVACSMNMDFDDEIKSTHFKVVIQNDQNKNLFNFNTTMKLMHVEMKGALAVTHEKLKEEWGKEGNEVVVNIHQTEPEDNYWIVEEVKTKAAPVDTLTISFAQKFWEANIAMFSLWVYKDPKAGSHQYTSSIFEWPIATTSIAYYHDKVKNTKINLMGNSVSWRGGIAAFLLCFMTFVISSAREARNWATKLECDELPRLKTMLLMCATAWSLHMTQIFYTDHPKFLYSYIPALVFKHLLHACTLETITKFMGTKFLVLYICLFLPFVLHQFNILKQEIYGLSHYAGNLTGIKQHYSTEL